MVIHGLQNKRINEKRERKKKEKKEKLNKYSLSRYHGKFLHLLFQVTKHMINVICHGELFISKKKLKKEIKRETNL